MVQFNFSERTIKAKVVYYGPPQSGKTTNLEQIHRISDPQGANRLISLNTAQDRTLFFDLLPFSLGTVSGYDFKIQLYTVPGQVQYNATRRVVLAGADAVVFVADSRQPSAKENQAAFENMKVNLLANRLVPEKVPLVVQYNKQDLDPLVARAELDRTLNPWGRKAFPAIAARGEGVMETFAAVVQEMLAAIAVKYNLKEKGLDPESVPEIVAEAFAEIVRKGPPRPAPSGPLPPLAPKVVIQEPPGAEPAYPGQVGPEVNPVSEELLHRAIRANVELAQTLGSLVREVHEGLGAIAGHASRLGAAHDEAQRIALVSTIDGQVKRLQQLLRDTGQPAASRAPGPPQTPATPPRGVSASAPPGRPAATPPPPLPFPQRPAPAAEPSVAARPQAAPAGAAQAQPALSPAAAPAAASSLDALVAEATLASRPALAARPVSVSSSIARGAPLPRCPPQNLRRSLAALLQGLAGVVAPQSTIALRAERKPVLLRGKDGAETKRDFMMITASHAGGLSEADQQRVLRGADPGPLGEAHRLVREMGGFVRFAPLPAGALETRLFVPAS
jgi:hypothetical protein